MLYPILTESRLLSDLSGVWDFKLDNGNGFDEKWYEAAIITTGTFFNTSPYLLYYRSF